MVYSSDGENNRLEIDNVLGDLTSLIKWMVGEEGMAG
jgi:hypothetical protein